MRTGGEDCPEATTFTIIGSNDLRAPEMCPSNLGAKRALSVGAITGITIACIVIVAAGAAVFMRARSGANGNAASASAKADDNGIELEEQRNPGGPQGAGGDDL